LVFITQKHLGVWLTQDTFISYVCDRWGLKITGPSQVITNIRSTFYIGDRKLSIKLARLRQFLDAHETTTTVNVLLLFFFLLNYSAPKLQIF